MPNQNIKQFLLIFSLIFSIGCSHTDSSYASEVKILGLWVVEVIEYPDHTRKSLGGDNAIRFDKNHITEIIPGFGGRRYAYTRSGDTLIVSMGRDQVPWYVEGADLKYLRIRTPIGTYLLTQKSEALNKVTGTD